MLQSLHIMNFAIIEDTWIELAPGANVFTGETGSGKSILMDALAILLGRRASVDLIRNGKDFFRVEGVFSAEPEILPLLEEMGADTGEGEIIISRRMNRSGRGICTVNGALCTVKQLEKLGARLVRLHEQNDNSELLSPEFCRFLVDHSDEAVLAAWNDYCTVYQEWKSVRDSLNQFRQQKQERERRLDILQWEIEQIEKAQIQSPDEDEAVKSRLMLLENHEKIYLEIRRALELLSGESGAQNTLAEAAHHIGNIRRFDAAFAEMETSLQNALYAVEDVISDMENSADSAEFSEDELMDLQNRDETLSLLKSKYGPELKDVLAYLEKAQDEFAKLHDMVHDNGRMQQKFRELTDTALEKGRALNALRREKGGALCRAITEGLREMNMEHAELSLHLEESGEPLASGAAAMDFYFSANPGEPLRPMRQTASGGEISRIALSIEDIMAHLFSCQTLVFDEIDTGISGGAALRVARKIRHLSRSVQVLCITHMPQTASMADAHYSIRKLVAEGRTLTKAVLLTEEEHIQDIAWMISGNRPPNESAVQSARELQEAVR